MNAKFKKDEWVRFKPEFQDDGDEEIGFRCCEDEDGGRVLVMACIGAPINPTQVVNTEWIEHDNELDTP